MNEFNLCRLLLSTHTVIYGGDVTSVIFCLITVNITCVAIATGDTRRGEARRVETRISMAKFQYFPGTFSVEKVDWRGRAILFSLLLSLM